MRRPSVLIAGSFLLALALPSDASAAPNLIGQWTFEPGQETVDATGKWGALQLMGNASIANGQLDLNGAETTVKGWARANVYSGGIIREKTLVSWVSLDSLGAWAGTAMGIDNIVSDNFDSIVYAERVSRRWMAGSSFFRRTQDVVTVDDTELNSVRQMAISYKDIGFNRVRITICRNGVQLGQYDSASMTQWSGGNAQILFGPRHTSFETSGFHGALDAHIEEARIYDGPMTCAEAAAIVLNPDADGDGVPDADDTCPGYDDRLDDDGDGVADGCDVCFGDDATGDEDSDGVCDDEDACEGDDSAGDTDGDLFCDDTDNCPVNANGDQADDDQDGIGDACDDGDADGVLDVNDNCPVDANPDQADTDADAEGDACDADDDGDSVADENDNCQVVANADQADFDDDSQGDACDGDDDADGILDEDDACPSTPMDVPFDDGGCSGSQRVELTCPSTATACAAYDNHGQYVSCVTHAANDARSQGLITNNEKAAITRAAAKSSCGK